MDGIAWGGRLRIAWDLTSWDWPMAGSFVLSNVSFMECLGMAGGFPKRGDGSGPRTEDQLGTPTTITATVGLACAT